MWKKDLEGSGIGNAFYVLMSAPFIKSHFTDCWEFSRIFFSLLHWWKIEFRTVNRVRLNHSIAFLMKPESILVYKKIKSNKKCFYG